MTGESHRPTDCPSCGRFVGPYETCPYCGADVGRRMPVRLVKFGSLVLAVAGVLLLLLVAARGQVPAVEVGSLAGTMNWAYLRIQGTVSRQPTYDPESGTLRFWVQDGTGEILVLAYDKESTVLLEQDQVPVMGDTVVVEGTLRVRDDFQYLVLDMPRRLVIQSPQPAVMAVTEVEAGLHLHRVTVQGMLRDDRIAYEGLRVLTVRDETGAIDVVLPLGQEMISGLFPDLHLGQPVQATGAVDLYRGIPQVSVGRGSDLVVLDVPASVAADLPAGEIGPEDVGCMVRIEGQIVRVEPFSAGVKLALDDGSGTMVLLLWQDLYDSLPERDILLEGAIVRAQGLVTEYRDHLEIVPELSLDVEFVAAAQHPASEPRLGDLSAADVGRRVVVEGVLTSLQSFSAGIRGALADGSGTVTLLLWQDVYDGLSQPASVVPGAVLRVEGKVAEYEGSLEIVPESPSDVGVVGVLELPRDERTIGQLGGEDAGRTVWLSGRLAGGTSFSEGVRFTLDDGTGTIVLLLWQNLYDRLAAPESVRPGAEVSVRGEIAEFQGELEIVPQVPFDVIVTGQGAEAVATPLPVATVPVTPTAVALRALSDIGAGDVGSEVALARAKIEDVSYLTKGIKYTLGDGSGRIVLLVWQDVLEAAPHRYDLYTGAQVQVTGRVDEYQGELEIVPRSAAGLVVLAPGERQPIGMRATNSLSPGDQGQVVQVEGVVSRVDGEGAAAGGGWLRLWLDDGSGPVQVYLPQRVVDYLPDGLGEGVRLRVTGEVTVYQGQVQVIPLAAADVEVR